MRINLAMLRDCIDFVISDNLKYFLTETLITPLNISTEVKEMDSVLNAIEGLMTSLKQLHELISLITNILQISKFC